LEPIISYDDWFKCGVSLIDFCRKRNIKLSQGLDAFKYISQLNPDKYNEQNTIKQWNEWCNSDYQGNKITEKTIIKKSKDQKVINELDIISQNPAISFHNIKHTEINAQKQFIEALFDGNGLENIHDLISQSCTNRDIYSICSKDGYKIKCRNCDFTYPPNNIPISKETTPYIFNMIILQDNNIKNKQTLLVAQYLLKHTKILYNNRLWYQFNESTGIYEKQDELVILKTFDNIINNIKQNGESEEWFVWLEHINYQKNLLEEFKKQCFSTELLDSNNFLLGFNNGVFDLQTNTFRKGAIEDFVSMKCKFDYDPNYSTDLVLQILSDLFPEEDEREFALSKLALALEGYNREQKITFNYGYTASNGKSFIMELMNNILGDYSDSFPVTTLTGKMKDAGEANSTVSGFRNKRFLYCSEPEAGAKINSNYIKTLTGDTIKVRKLYSVDDIEINPTYKIFMCCNALPNFDTYDEGIARRISLLEYKTRFCEEPKKKNEKLLKKYSKEELETIQKGLLLSLIHI
jgi:P4 family phage/plasmid primase-like protien